MADNADRKALFPYDRNDGDEATAHDPLMELSLIAGFDETPREEHGEAPPDGTPVTDEVPVAAEPDDGAQIDLEDALEAELDPSPAPAEPAYTPEDTFSADPPSDETTSAAQEPMEIPAFLSAGDTGEATRSGDAGSAMEAELDLPPSAPVSAWQPSEPADDPAPSVSAEQAGGDRYDDDPAGAEPEAFAPADTPIAETGEDAEQPLDAVFGTTEDTPPSEPTGWQAPTETEPAAEPMPVSEPEPAVASPSLEDELAAMLSGCSAPAPASDPEPVVAHAEPMPDLHDAVEPETDRDAVAGFSPTEPHDAPASAPDDVPSAEALADDWSDIEAAWSAAGSDASDAPYADDDLDAASKDASASLPAEQGQAGDGPVFSRATPVAPDFEVPAPARADVPQSTAGADPEADGSAFDIESDFVTAFDEALADTAPLDEGGDHGWSEPALAPRDDASAPAPDGSAPIDPVDELAAIMGLERGPDPDAPFVPAGAETRSIEDMDADFQSALEQEFPEFEDAGLTRPVQAGATLPAEAVPAAEAPVLDTVDMSGFEGVAAADFDVPEFEAPSDATLADGAFSGLEDELASAFDEDTPDRPVAEPKSDPVPADLFDDTTFDAAGFEAELARDIEFVGHDLDTARQADGFDEAQPRAASATGETQPANSGRRAIIIGAVVAGLAILGIGGVLALSGGDSAVDDGPVLVEADAEPVKIEPDDPGGTTVPNQDRAVFASGSDAEPEQENLVSTAEEPVDIASAPADGLPSPVAAGGAKSEDRLIEGGTESTTQDAIAPITPRRVRTLVVRPDGTLEERAPAPAPAANADTPALAAATDTAPAADEPAATETTAPIVGEAETVAGLPVDGGNDGSAVADTPAPTADAATDGTTDSRTGTTDDDADSAPVVVRRVQTTTATPTEIASRPADQPVNVVNRQNAAASAPAGTPEPQPASTTPTPTVTNGSTGGFTVQLAALPSEEAARATATRLSQQYGSLIAGRGMTIQRAVIEGRGTFYRIRVAADGSGDANSLCNRIKASGGNCFVAR